MILFDGFGSFCNEFQLPRAFGLRLGGRLGGIMRMFTPHPITEGMTQLTINIGVGITRAPARATMLGFLSGTPVMSIMRVGAGQVFFLGSNVALLGVPQPLVANLLAFML